VSVFVFLQVAEHDRGCRGGEDDARGTAQRECGGRDGLLRQRASRLQEQAARLVRRVSWPLHDIAITNIVDGVRYIKGGSGGVAYCATVVQ